jgi:hypothetical protein
MTGQGIYALVLSPDKAIYINILHGARKRRHLAIVVLFYSA